LIFFNLVQQALALPCCTQTQSIPPQGRRYLRRALHCPLEADEVSVRLAELGGYGKIGNASAKLSICNSSTESGGS
jgi:hypothetical protein